MQLRPRQHGFTLTELAVVFAVIALLMGGALMTLSAQLEQRSSDETVRRLNAAAEAVLAYAIVNSRLPCPAIGTGGDEAGAPNCTSWYGGFLPARTIGFQPTDASGYGIDAWSNRIRYAVAQNVTAAYCGGTATNPHFTSQANLKLNGVCWKPSDLDVCADAACASRVVSQNNVAFIVFSTGKNGANAASYGAAESENTDGDAVFVSRTPSGSEATGGYYDDLMVFVSAGILYSKLISAAVLP
jgi:prepilin-type N-terminal cleavage/methylation domain-containing protein